MRGGSLAGESASRPVAVQVAVAVCGLYWTAAMITSAVTLAGIGAGVEWAMTAFWGIAVALLLVSVWRGGPTATRVVTTFARRIGPVLVGLPMLMFLTVASGHRTSPQLLLGLAIPIGAGAVLIGTAVLLGRPEVSAWTVGRTARPRTSPPTARGR